MPVGVSQHPAGTEPVSDGRRGHREATSPLTLAAIAILIACQKRGERNALPTTVSQKNGNMDPRRVEMLADRIRESKKPSGDTLKFKKHLDAAREKLEYLQALRRQLQKNLARVSGERDDALRELQRLRARMGPRAITPCDVHETVIDQLQTERAFLLQALENVLMDLTEDGSGSVDIATERARDSLDVLQRLDKAG